MGRDFHYPARAVFHGNAYTERQYEMTFTIRIAEHCIGIDSVYENVFRLCRDYLTDGTPEFSVSVCGPDIDMERILSAETDRSEGREPVRYTGAQLEETAVYRKICDALATSGTILFHSSAVAVDGMAYLFAAPSGTGKSTHAALWKRYLGDKAVIVNDDKPLVLVSNGQAFVYGTPWSGKHGLNADLRVKVRAVCFIERAEENRIVKLDGRRMIPCIMNQTYRPSDPVLYSHVINTVSEFSSAAAFYRLGCNMDISAAETAYRAMKPEGDYEI